MTPSDDAGTGAALLAFGRLVRRLRLAADVTQEELAERARVSPRLISDIERGTTHRPRRDTAELLADGLRVRGVDRDRFIALARGRVSEGAVPDVASAAWRPLPRPPTPIIGRLDEIAAALALLLDGDAQLLTLTGPGGVGKTRLAVEIAHRLTEIAGVEVALVELAPLDDGGLVPGAVAAAVGVVADPARPLRQGIIATLQERPPLLVLDNCEHLASLGTFVAELLAACPDLTILATSRKSLHLRAEHEYPVRPLPSPDLATPPRISDLAANPAIDLFVRRARAANQQFVLTEGNAAAVAAIVKQLDGLPLALELAAPRLKVLSPAALLARLESRLPLLSGGAEDFPARHQTLRRTLDWSYDLLAPDEQMFFRRLAVFAGGGTLEAIEAVTGLSSALDLVTSLVDVSLLVSREDEDQPRFSMLETVREYGLERLRETDGDAFWRGKHLEWALALAERAEPELTGPEQSWWFARLRAEQGNLRGALDWAITTGDAPAAMRLGAALYRFWATQGYFEEGSRWLDQVLALDTEARTAGRGHALLGAGVMAYFRGEYDWASTLWDEAKSIFLELDDTRGIAYCHGNLGLAADGQGDFARARASYEAALTLFRQLDDPMYIGFMLHNLGLIAFFEADYARGKGLFAESLTLAQAREDHNSVALTLGNLALIALAEGDLNAATAHQLEALRIGQSLGNGPWLARAIDQVGFIAAAGQDGVRAAHLFGAAGAARDQFGAATAAHDRDFAARFTTLARAAIGDDAFAAAWQEGASWTLETAIAYALEETHPATEQPTIEHRNLIADSR